MCALPREVDKGNAVERVIRRRLIGGDGRVNILRITVNTAFYDLHILEIYPPVDCCQTMVYVSENLSTKVEGKDGDRR
jgi:hypothetical protein